MALFLLLVDTVAVAGDGAVIDGESTVDQMHEYNYSAYIHFNLSSQKADDEESRAYDVLQR